MAKYKTSLTFTERAARIAKSPVMALALVTAAIPTGIGYYVANEAPAYSDQIPAGVTPAQRQASYAVLRTEGNRLHNQGITLQRETKNIEVSRTKASEAESINLRIRYDRLIEASHQKDADLARYHAQLVGSPFLSEQDITRLYSQSLRGQAHDDFYKEHVIFRDECRISLGYGNTDISSEAAADTTKRRHLKTCMADRVELESDKGGTVFNVSVIGGFASWLVLGGAFGVAARRSRRKADKKTTDDYAAKLKKLEDLIKPKTP